MERTLTPLVGYKEMKWAIEKAGEWFIGSYMIEFVDSYEKLQNSNSKTKFLEYFMKEYSCVTSDMKQLRNRVNLAIRIIESGMVEETMEYILNTNDEKIGCEESKINAQFMLDRLKSGESRLPVSND